MSAEPPAADASGSVAGSNLPVLITTVDVGNGRTDRIELRQGDDPLQAAAAFCDKYSLPPSIIAPLARHIEENLDKASEASSESFTGGSADPASAQPSSTASTGAAATAAGILRSSSDANSAPEQLESSRQAALQQVQQMLSDPGGPFEYHETGFKSTDHAVTKQLRSGQTATTVFNRLYVQAKQKEARAEDKRRIRDAEIALAAQTSKNSINWVSHEMTKGRSSGKYDNYGERLYVEGVLDREKKKALTERRREEAAAAELQGATFEPRISKMALAMKQHGTESQEAWARLAKTKTNKTQDRLEMIKQERQQQEVKECTFRPRINHRSDKLMAERTVVLKEHHLTAYDQLFQDAYRRKLRQDDYSHWYPEEVTFKPRVNDPAKVLELDGQLMPTNNQPVEQRLWERHKQVEAKQELARAEADNPKDPTSGRPFFRPEIGRAPTYGRNQAALPIGDYLYGMRYEFEDKKAYLGALTQQQKENESAVRYTTRQSKHMMARLRRKRFSQIFEYLDQEGTGRVDLVALVSQGNEFLDTLDPEVRDDVLAAARIQAKRIIAGSTRGANAGWEANVLQEVQPSGCNSSNGHSSTTSCPMPVSPDVDLDGFCLLMDDALAKRHMPRSYLLPSPHVRNGAQEPTFQPSINPNSKVLAQHVRPHSQPVWKLLHKEAGVIKGKLQRKREELQQAQLQGCTFRPELVSDRLESVGHSRRSSSSGKGAAAISGKPPTWRADRAGALQPALDIQAAKAEAEYEALEREVWESLTGVSLTDELCGPTNQLALQKVNNLGTAVPNQVEGAAKHISQLHSISDAASTGQDSRLWDFDNNDTFLINTNANLLSLQSIPVPPELGRWESEASNLVAELIQPQGQGLSLTGLEELQGLAAAPCQV